MTIDVTMAVSSLIFAASRCGELPELYKLRSLFRYWYSNEFEASNVDSLQNNHVKSKLKNTLSAGSISDDVKLELIKDVISCLPRNSQHVRPKIGKTRFTVFIFPLLVLGLR